MKKVISLLLLFLFLVGIFAGCNSVSNEEDNQNSTPLQPTEEEILPTGIDIELPIYSTIWDISSNINAIAKITPANATTTDITWTSSNPDVASIYTTTSTYISPKNAGTTIITATTSNGISDTYELEVKSFCTYDFDLPLTFSGGTSSYRKTYEITNIEYLYNRSYSKLTFNVECTKTYDAQGSDNASSDIIARISLYDSEGYQVESQLIIVSGLLLNDKVIDTTVFFDVPTYDAPYTVKIIAY